MIKKTIITCCYKMLRKPRGRRKERVEYSEICSTCRHALRRVSLFISPSSPSSGCCGLVETENQRQLDLSRVEPVFSSHRVTSSAPIPAKTQGSGLDSDLLNCCLPAEANQYTKDPPVTYSPCLRLRVNCTF